jgi:hypothetical protein
MLALACSSVSCADALAFHQLYYLTMPKGASSGSIYEKTFLKRVKRSKDYFNPAFTQSSKICL